MDSSSASLKRGPGSPVHQYSGPSQFAGLKRSRGSFDCVLPPIQVRDQTLDSNRPHFATLQSDRALFAPDYNLDMRARQHGAQLNMNNQAYREGEELSGSIANNQAARGMSQSTIASQSPTSHHENIALPSLSPREESQREHATMRPSQPSRASASLGNLALQDYQMQLMLMEQQSKKRRMLERQALDIIPSLAGHLASTKGCVKDLLDNLPTHTKYIENFKLNIPQDTKALRGVERDLARKDAEIKALEDKYNELIELTPVPQRAGLEQVRNDALHTIQESRGSLQSRRDDAINKVESKNDEVAKIHEALEKVKRLMPDLIENLRELGPRLNAL